MKKKRYEFVLARGTVHRRARGFVIECRHADVELEDHMRTISVIVCLLHGYTGTDATWTRRNLPESADRLAAAGNGFQRADRRDVERVQPPQRQHVLQLDHDGRLGDLHRARPLTRSVRMTGFSPDQMRRGEERMAT